MDTSSTLTPPLSAKQEEWLRGWGNNWLHLWRVCANTACERARCCRGKPSACFTENFSRLPEGVQDWWVLLMEARQDGLPFDEAWAELTELGLVDELANWHDLVNGSGASAAVN
jgi:hypothetical protein